MPNRPRLAWRGLAALLAYTGLGLAYLRPIWETYGDHLAADGADPLFTLYTVKWVVHQARAGFPDLWNAPYFYPAHGALALSDHLIGPALQVAFLDNAVAAHNLLFFSSFVLSGLAAWWALEASGCSFAAALLGGAMFAFSPFRVSQLNHLAILLAQWIPLTLWSWDRLLAERTVRRAALFLAFYALHITGGCYLAYMIHVPLLAILLSRWAAEGRALLAPRSLRVLAPAAAVALAVTAAIFLPYLRVGRQLALAHDEREVVQHGAALASFLSPAPESWYSMLPPRALWRRSRLEPWRQPFVRSESSLFAGFVPTLFAALGIWDLRRRHRVRREAPLPAWRRASLLALALLAVALYALGDVYTLGLDHGTPLGPWLPSATPGLWNALGGAFLAALASWLWLRHRWGAAALRWREIDPWERGLALCGIACFLLAHPLVYLPLMRVVPGMSGMRVPARFAALLSFTIAFFAARGLDRLLARLRRPALRAAVLVAITAALAIELAPRPLHWVYVPPETEFPEVYRWLAAAPGVRAVVEVPVRQGWREARRMYFASLHWKPIANGYSGFVPASHALLAERLGRLPDGAGLDLLRALGITHLVLREPPAVLDGWARQLPPGSIALAHAAEGARVYRVLGARPRPP